MCVFRKAILLDCFINFKLIISLKMSSRKLYSNVVQSGSFEEDLGLVHSEQDRKIDGYVNWL